jgi:predicted nucleotidyltransferase
VNLFYDYHAPKFSLLDVVRVQERLSDLLGREVDAMTRGSVHPRIRQRVENEAIQVF